MELNCPIGYNIKNCSSKEYGLTCDTCYHKVNLDRKIDEIVIPYEKNNNIKDINEAIYDNNYKVCFVEPYKDNETIIYGKIQNFNPSGNIVVFVEDKFSLFIIPYQNIKWMIPTGLSRQYKEKININY